MTFTDGGAARRLRVLVVDDNRDSADSLGVLARLWGHETCVVYGGIDALAIDHDFLPDVMLLDLSMPGMDGKSGWPRRFANWWVARMLSLLL